MYRLYSGNVLMAYHSILIIYIVNLVNVSMGGHIQIKLKAHSYMPECAKYGHGLKLIHRFITNFLKHFAIVTY